MAWDPTQPPYGTPLVSAPIRANFQALDPLMGPDGAVFPIRAPDGTGVAPSYSFASAPGAGLSFVPPGGGYVGMLRLTDAVGSRQAFGTYNDGTLAFTEWDLIDPTSTWSAQLIVGDMGMGSPEVIIGAGGGIPLSLYATGTGWQIIPSTRQFRPSVDNTQDLGDATHRIRALYLGGETHFTAVAVAPATPPAGTGVLYCLASTKKLYFKNDAGVETALW